MIPVLLSADPAYIYLHLDDRRPLRIPLHEPEHLIPILLARWRAAQAGKLSPFATEGNPTQHQLDQKMAASLRHLPGQRPLPPSLRSLSREELASLDALSANLPL